MIIHISGPFYKSNKWACICPIEQPFQVIKRKLSHSLPQTYQLSCMIKTISDFPFSMRVLFSMVQYLNSIIINYPTLDHLFPNQVYFCFIPPAIWRFQMYLAIYFLFCFHSLYWSNHKIYTWTIYLIYCSMYQIIMHIYLDGLVKPNPLGTNQGDKIVH